MGGNTATTRAWRLALGLITLAIAAHLPALRAGFLWDDIEEYLVANPLIQAPDGLYRFWFTGQPTDYYPLTNSLFWIQWRLWGMNPAGYHATNIALHALCVVLAWLLLRRLAVPRAWAAAAIFAVHPVGVEAVAWISQTKTTLSTALLYGSLLCYPIAGEQQQMDGARRHSRGRWPHYAASFALYLAALLA